MTALTIVTIRYTRTVPASALTLSINDTEDFVFDNDSDALRFCAEIANDETVKVAGYKSTRPSSLKANLAGLASFKEIVNASF